MLVRIHDIDGIPLEFTQDFECEILMTSGWRNHLDEDEWCPKLQEFEDGRFIASYKDGKFKNCFADNGRIHIVANNHRLAPGRLRIRASVTLPSAIYPDGSQLICETKLTDIILVNCHADRLAAPPTIDIYLPIQLSKSHDTSFLYKPLPFQFCRRRTADHVDRDTVYFDRRRNLFVTADGDPAPEPYNETDAGDGTPRPSTSRRFVCCNRLYRHTGLQLVDTAIEALAGALPARRTPSINAHPGLAYLDRGIIRIPFHGGENRVSLKNMWYESIEINNQSVRHKNLVPLTECDIQIYDLDGIRAPYTVDGDNLIFTMPSMEYSDCTPACARVFLGVRYDGRIGVRYDGHGRKIFYRFCRHFSTPALPQPRRPFEFKIKIMRYPDRRCKFNISPTSGDHEIQVWLKRSYMAAGDDGQYIWVRRWQWRRVSRGVNVCMHTCLIRVRRKAGPLKSAWVYYHVDLRTGKIKPSRQQRM